MMKTTLTAIFVATFFIAGFSRAGDIQPGDSYPGVLAELGQPVGYMEIGNTKYLYYPRGTVTFSNDVVVLSTLMGSEEWVAHQEQERLAREQEVREEAMLRARRMEDGLALKQRMISEPEFTTAPVEKRVALWREFMKRYPEVAVPDTYAEDLRQLELELAVRNEEAKKDRKLAELEARVNQAEARAAYAVVRASEAENRARDAEQLSSFGTRYETPFAGYYPYGYYYLYPQRQKETSRRSAVYPRRPRTGAKVTAWTYQDRHPAISDQPEPRDTPQPSRFAPLSFGDRGGYENDALSFGSGGYYRGR